MRHSISLTLGLALGFGLGAASLAEAKTLRVEITNTQGAGGLYLTPLFTVFHDGGFDAFDAGSAASAAVEDLAEEGAVGGLIAEAGSNTHGVITSPGGFPGAPVIDPGETASLTFDVDPFTGRYLSFLSMVIPSNDTFLGNDDPFAYQVFDAMGGFANISPIQIVGGDLWDAGSEVNATAGSGIGAAFSPNGGPPGSGTVEGGVVTAAGNLDFLVGTLIPTGDRIQTVPGSTDLLATITVSQVPLPAGLPMLAAALGLLGWMRRARH